MTLGLDLMGARCAPTIAALAVGLAALWTTPGSAAAQECRVVEVDMTPSPDLQMVAWLEDSAGNYVDTIYITMLTGSYGMGNRPGMMTFNSGWRWPYGRRTTTFPVWAHRHGMEWPLVIFQNEDDTNLSHPLGQSSVEEFYCRPLREDEAQWDTQTCASIIYTDKGTFSPDATSLYPPRRDLMYSEPIDDEDVMGYAPMNPFDSVSRATPEGDAPFQISWPIPEGFAQGDYVLWIEVSQEFDQNEYYAYPEPTGIPWSEYGLPYRGQPSVLYNVPFTIGADPVVASTMDYVGYGDPEGLDGDVRAPDQTITTGMDGSGASRLLLTVDGQDMFRVRLGSRPTQDEVAPQQVDDLGIYDLSSSSVTLSFSAPQDDLADEAVTGYEIRYLAGTEITEENFDQALLVPASLTPAAPGVSQNVTISNLVPRSRYYIAMRPYDECRNQGELSVIEVVTPERELGEVSACFVATAAFGSPMESDVDMLRRFRDRFLRTHATGELLVEGYYTFGPGLARMIAPSDTARRAARASLGPLVEAVRGLAPQR